MLLIDAGWDLDSGWYLGLFHEVPVFTSSPAEELGLLLLFAVFTPVGLKVQLVGPSGGVVGGCTYSLQELLFVLVFLLLESR